jgi:hypothetical protein
VLNVLSLFADQMYASAMGCMGNRDVLTPDLGRPAARGVLFRNCYSAAPLYAGRPVARAAGVCRDAGAAKGRVRARRSDAIARARARRCRRFMGRCMVCDVGTEVEDADPSPCHRPFGGFGIIVRYAQGRRSNMWAVGATNYVVASLFNLILQPCERAISCPPQPRGPSARWAASGTCWPILCFSSLWRCEGWPSPRRWSAWPCSFRWSPR